MSQTIICHYLDKHIPQILRLVNDINLVLLEIGSGANIRWTAILLIGSKNTPLIVVITIYLKEREEQKEKERKKKITLVNVSKEQKHG